MLQNVPVLLDTGIGSDIDDAVCDMRRRIAVNVKPAAFFEHYFGTVGG
jgi:hypothetical protein